MILWLLLHWKIAALVLVAILVGVCFLSQAVLAFLIRYRLPIGIASVLLMTHGAVAIGVKQRYDEREAMRVLRQEKALLHTHIKTLENDAKEATAMQATIREYDLRVKELTDALEDANRVCFAPPDARRLRDLWK